MNNRIPKARKTEINSDSVPRQVGLKRTNDGIKFSFETLDRTEYFNLDGTCVNWATDLFDMLKDISGHSVVELISGGFQRKYRVHNHEAANPPSPLPDGIELKDCYQIRISTSKGGIHGVFAENVFYVIWFDPFHNMYPDERYGGLRKVRAGSTCCKDRDEEIIKLSEQLTQTQNELNACKELLDMAAQ